MSIDERTVENVDEAFRTVKHVLFTANEEQHEITQRHLDLLLDHILQLEFRLQKTSALLQGALAACNGKP